MWDHQNILQSSKLDRYHIYMHQLNIIAKTKCAKSENETSKTSLFSLPNSLQLFPMFERLERVRQLSRK